MIVHKSREIPVGRRRRWAACSRLAPILAVLLATVLLLLLAAVAAAQDGVVGLDRGDPKPEFAVGALGYGLSVFSGTEPERFEVEVLGTMRNLNPGIDLLMVRLTGKGLETSGVVAGMSGSPVFIDNRLAGAVAYGWSFSNEAIAGVTPIAEMRALADLPKAAPLTPAPSVRFSQLLSGDLPTDLLARQLANLVPKIGSGARSNLLWATVGFNDSTRNLLRQNLGALAPAGSTSSMTADLEAGSAVAGVLIDGDFRMAVTGTVTERSGSEILAFGHSFMGLGPIQIPMAVAEIVTVISSQNSSFKLANLGPVVGAFDQDRFAGLLGRIGAKAPTIPMEIRFNSEPRRTYNVELAALPRITPSLIATTILNTLGTARQRGGDQGIWIRAAIAMRSRKPLIVEQAFDGPSAPINTAVYVLALVAFILQNPEEEVVVERVDIDLEQWSQPQATSLLDANADRRTVHPGDVVSVHLDLREYRGNEYRRTIEVEIPDDAPAGNYYLFLGDGASVDALSRQIEPREPKNFEEALDILRGQHSTRDFVVLGVAPGSGLIVEGRSLPELPPSMRSIWQASGPLSSKPLTLAVRQESSERLERPLRGAARIDLRVRPRHD